MAVIFAITTVKSADLNLRMRTFRLLPMFLFPALSYVIYSGLANVTKFCKFINSNTFFYFFYIIDKHMLSQLI